MEERSGRMRLLATIVPPGIRLPRVASGGGVRFNRSRMTRPKPLYLCAGLQSSGSTVVSWCFLQRADMDGVFDARNDILPDIPDVTAPRAWCKITISSFRFSEM